MGLTPVDSAAAEVVACSTCRRSVDGSRGGSALADALRRVRASDPSFADVAIREMPCLFACQEHCAVHLRAPGKIGYVLGRFDPDGSAARAILDYTRAYALSDSGQVPYRDWPEGVKGHFLVRTPPPGFVVE